ncbi:MULTISPECIES: ATP-grasp domain-containing protein [Bacillus cereus group]|uniref:ATP-grasp domain-containing protein n=1 Tax=Bacillus thuringiensis serovar mexicanensis TaxID=180868 RepID=A0A2C9YG19_BACTU|nr:MULTISPECIES: ATP-grasp domain-containing protein [Bacillus cereus group]MEB9674044.1 ATP-grasp domain-containing protein [Bacillus anthracis]OTW52669.1 hypothetical protein BK699_05850 [Bacillus thuringiensis serovar mexicanensis]OTX09975.1 hypothetical protein BK705_03725 [Bacillus thuringiensis serovar monterrey]
MINMILFIENSSKLIKKFYELAIRNKDKVSFLVKKEVDDVPPEYQIVWDIKVEPIETTVHMLKKDGYSFDRIITIQEGYLEEVEILCEKLNIKNIMFETAKNFRDKYFMKKLFIENSIPTPKMELLELKPLQENIISFPCVVKPLSGFGSIGVKKVESIDELNNIIKIHSLIDKVSLKNFNPKHKVLVEEYISGVEYAVDIIWQNRKPLTTVVTCKGVMKGPYFYDREYILVSPKEDLYTELEKAAVRVNKCLGIINGATHTELKFDKDQIYCIESTCRPGAAGAFYKLAELSTEYRFFNLLYYTLTSSKDFSNEKFNEQIKYNTDNIYFWYNFPFKNKGINYNINEKYLKNNLSYYEIDYINTEIRNTDEFMTPSYFCTLTGVMDKNLNMSRFLETLCNEE